MTSAESSRTHKFKTKFKMFLNNKQKRLNTSTNANNSSNIYININNDDDIDNQKSRSLKNNKDDKNSHPKLANKHLRTLDSKFLSFKIQN
jgi:menaquinone-dependent protoporphyrinogen IX oxidase